MRRLPMTLFLALALAGCNDAPPPAGPPLPGVRVSFPPGGVANVIHVEAVDALPLRGADLVAPDGTLTASNYVDADPNPWAATGRSTVNDPYRSSMLGNSGNNPLPNAPLSPMVNAQSRLLLTVSRADITLPDPVAYRRNWQNYRIRLSFAPGAGQIEARDIPAPRPPGS